MTNKHEPRSPELSPELERYLALCERAYQRMVETGKWPWADSPNPGAMVESDDNLNEI